ncbi:gfo/Idh/MocA family oxidoreductase [Pseudomonas gingeri NCPPB 3146 = LMG 5327]|uniref:Gfo/Idh/MocA family oxidoreductase n=2 Tax=Pseudomonas gingeri TaxID=117681 RepID=A0A7Y7Y314_9PSED|nr:Gfo/Idh/MocA family oxidoreductase [Pseudomonas gingeri]NWC16982.1 Gfo/Idh/MocA family oxidoreductase [Pseudomonas gingeri]PNQ93928.1 gfo/Idh/MocA family oxidoreductase [Pseudomonas gingeri NCPPB 3146 = LMG 5327]
MREEVLKVGLIGLGNMGRNHLRVLSMLKGVELAFVSDADAAVAARAGAVHSVPGVIDPTPLLANVDAVVICTPTVTHADYIRLAASQVKNIFVEKPLAATLDECRDIATFAKEKGLNIQVGFIERFNPAVQALKVVLEKSEQVISVDFTRTNKVSSRITDVDVVTDLMIHDIDLALFLNGPAKSVVAHGFAHGSMIDFASALITHENGQFSRIQASRVTDKKKRQIEATCTDMFVDCDLLRKEIIINRQSETKQGDVLPYTISAIQEAVAVPPQEALLSELQAFVASCRQASLVNVPGVDAGVEAMKICAVIQAAVQV